MKRGGLWVGALIAVGIAILWLQRAGPEPRSASQSAAAPDARSQARVEAACGSCHLVPAPDVLPRAFWRTSIEKMADLVDVLLPEDQREAARFSVAEMVRWYEQRAPERLEPEASLTRAGPPPVRFRRRFVLLGPESGPAVATVQRLDGPLIPGFPAVVASANMVSGGIHAFSLTAGPRLLGSAGHPARVVPEDLDGDGDLDLVVSDLGSPMPTEERVGRVVLAVSDGEGRFGFRTVVEGIGRVADARPVDLDADGRIELVVAAFGGLREGGIYYARPVADRELAYRVERVSPRTGAVSVVPVVDLAPGSGPGFVVAFSQQHEVVASFERRGTGFEERVLYRAPHPNWGMSNLQAVDLDRDGDTDLLLAHGDTLDDGLAFKPYHGIQWLENRSGEFRAHAIGPLYGAHQAAVGDLDGDGDLDIVACGFLPQVRLPVREPGPHVDSIIFFERTDTGWVPYAIEKDHPRHTSLTLVDLNDDGRLDIVAAVNRAWDVSPLEEGPSLEIWFNEGPAEMAVPDP